MKRGLTPKLPLSLGGVYLLSGKTFPALTSKLALVAQARNGVFLALRRAQCVCSNRPEEDAAWSHLQQAP